MKRPRRLFDTRSERVIDARLREVLDADVRDCFSRLDHSWLVKFLEHERGLLGERISLRPQTAGLGLAKRADLW